MSWESDLPTPQEKDPPPHPQGLTASSPIYHQPGANVPGCFLMDTILTNSKARHEYHIEETFEAGIVLSGTEVKSLRAGKGQIRMRSPVWRTTRFGCTTHTSMNTRTATPPTTNPRPSASCCCTSGRCKLFGVAAIKGKALVPLSLYWKNGKVKVQLAVGRGKDSADKRQTIKKRDSDRELRQTMMRRHGSAWPSGSGQAEVYATYFSSRTHAL